MSYRAYCTTAINNIWIFFIEWPTNTHVHACGTLRWIPELQNATVKSQNMHNSQRSHVEVQKLHIWITSWLCILTIFKKRRNVLIKYIGERTSLVKKYQVIIKRLSKGNFNYNFHIKPVEIFQRMTSLIACRTTSHSPGVASGEIK